jgi:hypothetical protein
LLGWALPGLAFVTAAFRGGRFLLARENHPDILTPGKYHLALKYHLPEDQVFMDAKPKRLPFSKKWNRYGSPVRR